MNYLTFQIPNNVAVANAPAAQLQQITTAPSTIHIPGIGNVQVLNAPSQMIAPAQVATQQALQQDPNDPNKWHVVQVATAQTPQINPVAQFLNCSTAVAVNSTDQQQNIVSNGQTNGIAAVASGTTATAAAATTTVQGASASGQPQKTRLRRVACTCPNCKDGDRTRSK